MTRKWSTRTAHAGARGPDVPLRPHTPPIFQTVAFEYDTAKEAEAAASSLAHLYARDGGPTDELLARAVAELEGAEAALVFSSGMGAIAAAALAFVGAGDHVVAQAGLYGRSHELYADVLPRLGVRTTLVDEATPARVQAALEPTTKLVHVESISNPLLRVADVDGLAQLTRSHQIALFVDATFATPLGQRPVERGATLSLHSATKYLNGHGDALGGVASGSTETIARVARLRSIAGAAPDPFAAWLILRGVRTLALRFARQAETAERVARALEGVPGVVRVFYPRLASHPDHALAQTNLETGGAMVSFEVAGGLDGARRVYDRLGLIARAASLGDLTSLMTHPARFSHLRVDAQTRARAGISDGLLRLSVGIEDPDDLIEDLTQALR